MASGSEFLPISSAGVTHFSAGVSVPTLRLWVELAFARRGAPPLPCHCLDGTHLLLRRFDHGNLPWRITGAHGASLPDLHALLKTGTVTADVKDHSFNEKDA